MAKAKYTKQKNGYFQTRVWDGGYNDDGTKHYVTLRSKKSSKDLENKVNQFNQDVETRKHLRISDVTFYDYAKAWMDVYKAGYTYAGGGCKHSVGERSGLACCRTERQPQN